MKLKIIIIGLLAMASINSLAQTIEYTYDAAGNRTSRKVIPAGPPSAPAQEQTNEPFDNNNEEKQKPEVYNDIIAETELKIYPNPTRGKLKIDIVNYETNTNGNVKVFDLGGRLVYTINNLSQSMEIDITNEPAGSYIMVIVVNNQKSEWKIIKQ